MIQLDIVKLFVVWTFTSTTHGYNDSLYKIVYWEIEPYIFRGENGTVVGKFPAKLEALQKFCMKEPGVAVAEYVKMYPSYTDFKKFLYGSLTYRDHYNQTLWGPIITAENFTIDMYFNLNVFPLFSDVTTKMAVIVPRKNVYLVQKFWNGFHKILFILACTFLTSFIAATLFWLTEARFWTSGTRSGQAGDSIWWSLITMSTVGYGDITPKWLGSRLVAIVWMYVAMVSPCILTATTASLIFSDDSFDISGQTVAVLKNSFEKQVASDIYKTVNKEYEDYDSLIKAVQKNEVFAGLVNAEVAVWYENEKWKSIDSPIIVSFLPATIDVHWLLSAPLFNGMWNCMSMKHNEIDSYVKARYFRTTEPHILHIQTLEGTTVRYYPYILGMILGFIAFVMIFLGLENIFIRKKKERDHSRADIPSNNNSTTSNSNNNNNNNNNNKKSHNVYKDDSNINKTASVVQNRTKGELLQELKETLESGKRF